MIHDKHGWTEKERKSRESVLLMMMLIYLADDDVDIKATKTTQKKREKIFAYFNDKNETQNKTEATNMKWMEPFQRWKKAHLTYKNKCQIRRRFFWWIFEHLARNNYHPFRQHSCTCAQTVLFIRHTVPGINRIVYMYISQSMLIFLYTHICVSVCVWGRERGGRAVHVWVLKVVDLRNLRGA